MGPSTAALIAFLCLSGAQATSILRGKAVIKGLSSNSILKSKVEGVSSEKYSFSDKIFEKAKEVVEDPKARKQEAQTEKSWNLRIVLQLLFGIAYYFLIVTKYPKLEDGFTPTPEAIALQKKNVVLGTMEASMSNCVLSACCTGPRAAQTFHSAGVCDYWPSCILMSLFPCCTLWAVNSFTELNVKLGGEKNMLQHWAVNMLLGALSALFCSCCVVAQDAQSLDLITGVDTTLWGLENRKEKAMQDS